MDHNPHRGASRTWCHLAICLTSAAALPALDPFPHPGDSVALALTSGLSGSIHSHLDGSVVGGHLGGVGEHGDGQCETLPWGGRGKSRRLVPRATQNMQVFHLVCLPKKPPTF